MSASVIPAALRRSVRERAAGRCEYCLIHENDYLLPHEPDHIIALQHGGLTTLHNLAFAWFDCNRTKGPNISSIDTANGQVVPLFHPRNDVWTTHFRLEKGVIAPLTTVGRATAALLKFNLPKRIHNRELLQQTGRYPS